MGSYKKIGLSHEMGRIDTAPLMQTSANFGLSTRSNLRTHAIFEEYVSFNKAIPYLTTCKAIVFRGFTGRNVADINTRNVSLKAKSLIKCYKHHLFKICRSHFDLYGVPRGPKAPILIDPFFSKIRVAPAFGPLGTLKTYS